jgi:hypothetical protein
MAKDRVREITDEMIRSGTGEILDERIRSGIPESKSPAYWRRLPPLFCAWETNWMGRLLKVGAWGRRVGYYHGTTTTHLFFVAIHPLLKDGLCCSG